MRYLYKLNVSALCKSMVLLMLVVMTACGVEEREEGTGGPLNKGPVNVTTVAGDIETGIEGVVTVEVTDPDGTRTVALAESNGLIVRFKDPVNLSQQRRVLASASSNLTTQFSIIDGLCHVAIDPGQTLDLAFAALYVEPNYILTTTAIPNDPSFDSQWGLHNTGQSIGIVDADTDAPEAWDITTGNNTVIAVIDTGVDYNHPDLAGIFSMMIIIR